MKSSSSKHLPAQGGLATGWLSDVWFALRMLSRGRRFTVTAILTLALVIGANAAIFSLCHGVLLRPVEVRDIDRLVFVNLLDKSGRPRPVPTGTFRDWDRQSGPGVSMSAYFPSLAMLETADGLAEQIRGANVLPGFFETLGGKVSLGRTFGREELTGGGASVVVLSDGFWRRRFAGDPSVVGKTLTLGGVKHRIVGVMASGFAVPLQTDLWATADLRPLAEDRTQGLLRVFARLGPGMSATALGGTLGAVHERQKRTHPQMDQQTQVAVEPLRHLDLAGAAGILQIVLVASYFLLIVGCANLATQLLAQAIGRRKEMATRISLGASRLRIVRQLLIESLLLSVLGAAFGVLFAHWLIDGAKFTFSSLSFVPGFQSAGVDSVTMAYMGAVAVGTGFLFGLAPALQLARTNLNDVLKESGRGHVGSGRSRRARSVLVSVQVALAVLVAVGAVTFGSLLDQVLRDKGFSPKNISRLTVRLSQDQLRKPTEVAGVSEAVVRRLLALPGVKLAAAMSPPPYARDARMKLVEIEGEHHDQGRPPAAHVRAVSAHAHQVLGLPLLRGRMIRDSDREGAPPVTVVSRAFAETYFPPGVNPIGRRVSLKRSQGEPTWLTIVGIIEDIEQDPGKGMLPAVYVSSLQFFQDELTFLVRTMPGMDVVPHMRRVLQGHRSGLYVVAVGTLEELVADRLMGFRLLAALTVLFGFLALAIAAVGLNGAANFLVVERANEIGLRAAIGATPAGLVRFVVRNGLVVTGAGLILGLAASVPASGLLQSAFQVGAGLDPVLLGLVAACVFLVALLASLLPGLRASRLTPSVALRGD